MKTDDNATETAKIEEATRFLNGMSLSKLLEGLHFLKFMMMEGEESPANKDVIVNTAEKLAEQMAAIIEKSSSSAQILTSVMTLEAALMLARIRLIQAGNSDILWDTPK